MVSNEAVPDDENTGSSRRRRRRRGVLALLAAVAVVAVAVGVGIGVGTEDEQRAGTLQGPRELNWAPQIDFLSIMHNHVGIFRVQENAGFFLEVSLPGAVDTNPARVVVSARAVKGHWVCSWAGFGTPSKEFEWRERVTWAYRPTVCRDAQYAVKVRVFDRSGNFSKWSERTATARPIGGFGG
jgi:hypothetical protein